MLICHSKTKEIFPKPKTFLSYDNKKSAKYESPLSVIGFADFEAKLEKIENTSDECKNSVDNNKSINVKKNLHEVVSYSLIFIDNLGKLIYEKNYCGPHAGPDFFQTLNDIEENFY